MINKTYKKNKKIAKVEQKVFVPYVPSIGVLPGETLTEVLKEKGMTQKELAERVGRPLKTINEIVKGKTAITSDTSIQLEKALDVPAHIWNNLESNYREFLARMNMSFSIKAKITESKKYPYHEMAKWGWVPKERNPSKITDNLLKFFGVTSFENIIESSKIEGVFRISTRRKYNREAIIAWLRRGVIENYSKDVKEFDKQRLRNSIGKIRALTLINDPDLFLPELEKILSECGIAFTITPSLINAPISGVTRWLTSDKVLVQMSIRGKCSDIFWFSLFHELSHILDDNQEIHIDLVNNGVSEEREKRIDTIAANLLIPKDKYNSFIDVIKQRRTLVGIYDLIRSFSRTVSIHPGIVSGRLQSDHLIPPTCNRLRSKLRWVRRN